LFRNRTPKLRIIIHNQSDELKEPIKTPNPSLLPSKIDQFRLRATEEINCLAELGEAYRMGFHKRL